MMFNATFNNASTISWRSVGGGNRGPGENHLPGLKNDISDPNLLNYRYPVQLAQDNPCKWTIVYLLLLYCCYCIMLDSLLSFGLRPSRCCNS